MPVDVADAAAVTQEDAVRSESVAAMQPLASILQGGSGQHAHASSRPSDPVPLCLFVGKAELHVTVGEALKSSRSSGRTEKSARRVNRYENNTFRRVINV